ncbi:MAG: RCC1 domain-containing protein, partial [Planctomycetota bacterium]
MSAVEMQLAGGTTHTLLLDADGQVWAWGENSLGQLSVGYTTPTPGYETEAVPVQDVSQPLDDVIAIAAGDGFSVAVRADGSVVAWGLNDVGQLGDGSTSTVQNQPVSVLRANDSTQLDKVIAVAAGDDWAMALDADGVVWTWGRAGTWRGNLGNTSAMATPVQIDSSSLPLDGILRIAAGAEHGLALDVNGGVWAWGDNASGQVGDRVGSASYAGAIPVQ